MTNEEIIEIHKNNSDLNFKNLAAISGRAIEDLKIVFKDRFVIEG